MLSLSCACQFGGQNYSDTMDGGCDCSREQRDNDRIFDRAVPRLVEKKPLREDVAFSLHVTPPKNFRPTREYATALLTASATRNVLATYALVDGDHSLQRRVNKPVTDPKVETVVFDFGPKQFTATMNATGITTAIRAY